MNSHSFLLFDVSQQPEDGSPTPNPMFNVQPLSFDRVHGGHISSSGFPLFRIPVELFGHIIRYLSRSDLKSLALVDRDCFRLASLSLYKDVQVDVGSKSGQPIVDRHISPSPSSSIPYCVRRLTISSSPSLSQSREDAISQSSNNPSRKDSSQLICGIITNSLPNLHILDWNGPAFRSLALLHALQSSPVKHLRLKGSVLDPEPTYEFSQPIPLESLDLQISSSIYAPEQGSISFYRQLCRCVAPTLRQLRWKETTLMENDIFGVVDMPPFPNLRFLVFDMISSDSTNILRHLLGENTKVQSLSMDSVTSFTRNFFRTRGYVKSLKHFCWINYSCTDPSSDDILTFLQDNPQLETVHIPGPLAPTFIEDSFFPLIQCYYDALTSLHLVWDASEVPEQSLQNLASITTLRHLWLSAGNQGARKTWEVDHDSILKHLAPLRFLETLVFSHDTYPTTVHLLTPRFCDYYATKALPVDLDISKYLTPDEFLIYQGKNVDYDLAISQQIAMRRRAWESWHVEYMTAIAVKYAQTFQALRWCFIGQLALGRSELDSELSVICDSPRREPCLSSLHKKMTMTTWRPI